MFEGAAAFAQDITSRGLHSSTSRLNISTFCGLHTSTSQFVLSTFGVG